MTAHKHAALMAQYAQDAAETDRPWERWQVYIMGGWRNWDIPFTFYPESEYRRKPRTININGYEVPEPVRKECLEYDNTTSLILFPTPMRDFMSTDGGEALLTFGD